MRNPNIYKYSSFVNINMLPGDQFWSPDESFFSILVKLSQRVI